MTTGDTHADDKPTLFSLPEAAPAAVVRAGRLLARAGYLADAAEMYEHFIDGLRQHALSPVRAATPGEPGNDGGEGARLLRSLPVRAHPDRYSFA